MKAKAYDIVYKVEPVRYVHYGGPDDYPRLDNFVNSVNIKVKRPKYNLVKGESDGPIKAVLEGGPLWGDWQAVHDGDYIVDEGDQNLLVMNEEVFRTRYIRKRPRDDRGRRASR